MGVWRHISTDKPQIAELFNPTTDRARQAMNKSRWPWEPKPDSEALLATLRGERKSTPVQVLEFLVDPEIVTAILGKDLLPLPDHGESQSEMERAIDELIHFYYSLGMSAFRAKAILDLPFEQIIAEDTAEYS